MHKLIVPTLDEKELRRLAQTADKSNEIKAIPELLKVLDIQGCIVTMDAAGCQRLFAEARDTRRRSVDELPRPEVARVTEVDSGHGRIEERTAFLSRDLSWLTTVGDWKGLCGVGMVEAKRTNAVTHKEQAENRYYIVSDPSITVERLLELTRRHWSIENELHWVLDVEFKEDQSRIRSSHAAENFGALRRMALSLLKAAATP